MPGHLANDGPAAGAPTPIEGLDLALVMRNVARAGGDPGRFAASLAAAQQVDAAPARARDLAVLAAWRAGALAYRDAALERLDTLLAGGDGAGDGGADAAAAAVGLADAAEARVFAERQRTDRLWWPGRDAANGYVCSVGGFAGVGGAWVAPPAEGVALDEPGAFAIRTGDEWWRLDADAWGSRIVRTDVRPERAASGSPATIVCTADSYLAWVHVRDAA